MNQVPFILETIAKEGLEARAMRCCGAPVIGNFFVISKFKPFQRMEWVGRCESCGKTVGKFGPDPYIANLSVAEARARGVPDPIEMMTRLILDFVEVVDNDAPGGIVGQSCK